MLRLASHSVSLIVALVAVVSADRQVIRPSGLPDSPLFSHAIVSNGMVYVSGTVGLNVTGWSGSGGAQPTLCEGGIEAQTSCAFKLIEQVLGAWESPSVSLANIVDCTVFLASMEDYAGLNAAWTKIFPKDPPARAAFAAKELALGAAAEFKCIATLNL